jgi:hypothetical protein
MINKVFLSSLLSVFVFLSCGKDIENSKGKDEGTRGEQTAPNVSLDRFMQNQKLICEDVLFCPDNIAKIVVVVDDKIRYCTGTLIDDNRLITSASCLPRSLQIPRISCAANVFAVFPKTILSNEEKIVCDKIEYVDENLFAEPALWKSDIAIISLKSPVMRDIAKISNDGILDNEKLISWKVDYTSDYLGVLRQSECRSLFQSYLNPFTRKKFSPMFVGADCDFNEGTVGAPVFRDDELVGVYSKEMGSRIYNYLENSGVLDNKIGRYFHISNLACTGYNNFRFSFQPHEDCNVEITTKKLDSLRSNILKGKAIHESSMREIESEVEQPKRYFKWDFKFFADRRSTTFEIHPIRPKCIYRSQDWIVEFRRWRSIRTYAKVSIEVPQYIFKTRLDKNLRSKSVVENLGVKKFDVEFNPYGAFVNKDTYVTITSELHGQISKDTYESVLASCP